MTRELWRRVPEIAWTGNERRIVAAATSPPDSSGPRVLHGAAAWVWLELAEPSDVDSLVDRAQTMAIDPRADVLAALDALRAAGLVDGPSRSADRLAEP